MSLEEAIRKNWQALDRRDATAFVAAYAPDAVVHDPQYEAPLRGRDAIRGDVDGFLRAFPDLRAECQTVVVNGDTAASEGVLSGTHKGPLALPDGEAPATGKHIEMRAAVFLRTDAQGRIVEERRYFDLAGLMAQLGIGGQG